MTKLEALTKYLKEKIDAEWSGELRLTMHKGSLSVKIKRGETDFLDVEFDKEF